MGITTTQPEKKFHRRYYSRRLETVSNGSRSFCHYDLGSKHEAMSIDPYK